MGQDLGLSVAEAPVPPASVDLREELTDLEAYLRGLPENLLQAGLFVSYELRASELVRRIEFEEIAALSNVLIERLDGRYRADIQPLDKAPTYLDLRGTLQALGAAYERRTRHRLTFARATQGGFLAFAGMSCISVLFLPNPGGFAGMAIGNLMLVAAARWFEERWRAGFRVADEIRTLQDELARLYGPDGSVKPSFALYRSCQRRHQEIVAELNRRSKRKWYEPAVRT